MKNVHISIQLLLVVWACFSPILAQAKATNNHTGYAQVVEEKDASGNLLRTNYYGHDLVKTNFVTEGYERYYHYDGLGSVRALSDGNGDITDEYTYDAFGILLTSIGNTPNTYLYTGEQWDADLGMYFLRARYNNVQTGRFHNMDTYEGRRGEPMTLHKYLYVHANPVMNIDPSGNVALASFFVTVKNLSLTISRTLSNPQFTFAVGLTAGLSFGKQIGEIVVCGIVANILNDRNLQPDSNIDLFDELGFAAFQVIVGVLVTTSHKFTLEAFARFGLNLPIPTNPIASATLGWFVGQKLGIAFGAANMATRISVSGIDACRER